MVSKYFPTGSNISEVDGFEVKLREKRGALAKQLITLRERIEELGQTQAKVKEQLGHIDALLGEESNGEIVSGDDPRNFHEHPLADEVVKLIREHGGSLHYREIERKLRARGVVLPEGKDPANTLLARYFNDPRLYRPKRGTYALRNGRQVRSVGTRRSRSRKGK